jgi:bifunctional non-homologous end joining protein LigD
LPRRDAGALLLPEEFRQSRQVRVPDLPRLCAERAPHAQLPCRERRLAFDLDPAEDFADAARAALVLRAVLDDAGLRGYPKTTGGKGVHVVVPLAPGPSHADVLACAEMLAERMIERAPRLLTLAFSKRERRGRLYIDIRRNVFGATLVAPYSVRRRPHAPVSTPLAWDEVRPDLDPATLNVRTLPARLREADPWRDAVDDRQELPRDSSARARYTRARAAGSP